jgi:hypothetical protein
MKKDFRLRDLGEEISSIAEAFRTVTDEVATDRLLSRFYAIVAEMSGISSETRVDIRVKASAMILYAARYDTIRKAFSDLAISLAGDCLR